MNPGARCSCWLGPALFGLLLLTALARDQDPGRSIAPEAPGILYFVNTASDTVVIGACANGLPNCSLRGAIQVANSHLGADGIEIDLPPGSIINLMQALPVITESVSVVGAGADKLTVRRNTGGNYRIFNVNATGTVTFSGITISNGIDSSGGGIAVNQGTLNVLNMVITGNQAGTNGGGIINNGVLNVSNTLVAGNSAPLGGGIYNDGNCNLTNSTITGNMAQLGGGIFLGFGDVTLSNSTICRNTVNKGVGGGVVTQDTHPVTKNTIIALNTGDTQPDVFGDFSSQGFNLIGIRDGSGGFTQPTDQTGTLAQPLDPKLDPNGLQNNGGPTQTIALLLGSPAIDKGTSIGVNGTLTTDQRGTGFPRKVDYPTLVNAPGGDGTDIGAVEFGGPLVPLTVSRKVHGAGSFDIELPLTGGAGVECRSGGASNNHQLIMNFPGAVTLMEATVTTGVGSVGSFTVIGPQVTVNLLNVANAQTILLTLFGVSNGTNTSNVTIPMGVLLGDTNADRFVNSGDALQTRSRAGQAAAATNFRSDVNIDGVINSGDTTIARSRAGTAIP